MKRNIDNFCKVLFVLTFILTLASITTFADEVTTISGIVSLPQNEIAPVGGIEVGVFLDPIDVGDYCNATVIIPEGESSVAYSIDVPLYEPVLPYKLSYILNTWNTKYMTSGYYTTNGMAFDSSLTSVLDIDSNNSNYNLPLIEGTTISGRIRLPKGETAPPSGLNTTIEAMSIVDQSLYVTNFIIDEGKDYFDYVIAVPKCTQTVQYKLFYSLHTGDINYLPYGYYNIDCTVADEQSASVFSVSSNNKTAIDIEYIEMQYVDLKIALPCNNVNSDSVIIGDVYIFTDGGTKLNTSNFSILPGASDAITKIELSKQALQKPLKISYNLLVNNSKYTSIGYSIACGVTNDVNIWHGVTLDSNANNILYLVPISDTYTNISLFNNMRIATNLSHSDNTPITNDLIGGKIVRLQVQIKNNIAIDNNSASIMAALYSDSNKLFKLSNLTPHNIASIQNGITYIVADTEIPIEFSHSNIKVFTFNNLNTLSPLANVKASNQ